MIAYYDTVAQDDVVNFFLLLRYLLKLQTEEIQIHAEEMSNLRKELEEEKANRLDFEDRVTATMLRGVMPNVTSNLRSVTSIDTTSRSRNRLRNRCRFHTHLFIAIVKKAGPF